MSQQKILQMFLKCHVDLWWPVAQIVHAVSTLSITENSFIANEDYKNISDPVKQDIVKFESF